MKSDSIFGNNHNTNNEYYVNYLYAYILIAELLNSFLVFSWFSYTDGSSE